MKKILILLAVLAILPLTQLAAQSDGFKVFSFDIGYAPSYNVESADTDSQPLFGLNIMIGDDLTAGFTYTALASTTYTLLSLKYQIIDKLKVLVSVGSDGTDPVSGVGFEYAPFTRRYGEYLGTELKLMVEYAFEPGAIDEGRLFFGVALGVGI
ncbi:MAG: hypothetical protein LBK40_00395 [Spirochaetaceae bacterium]|jgi:hypothetical protein|nr:hypothetical protein [Spirochaetaceae bacterium]